MSIPIAPVLREVVVEVSAIDMERASQGKPIDYESIKDGMLYLHCAWQDLYKTVGAKKDLPEAALLPAVRLAAASLKFATDLGSPRWFDQFKDNQEKRHSLLLHKVQTAGKRFLAFLGLSKKTLTTTSV